MPPVEWQSVDLECRIKMNEQDKGLTGQNCIITGISAEICSVLLLKEARVISLLSQYLEPIRPNENDKCKIISEGDDTEATVVSINDDQDVVVRLKDDSHKKVTIYDLCKLGNKDAFSHH